MRRRPELQRTQSGGALLAAFRAAVEALDAHVDEINSLNVYPVPDGDTGSNMLATVRAALDEAERVAEPTLQAVAAAISFGALMGARGNSGVITSQIFRGMADALDGSRPFTGEDLARALAAGSRTACRAVARPVEGTILTVIREAADAAAEAAGRGGDVQSVLAATVLASQVALARTPTLLPILRDAGVVDAGGAGLVRLFEGALRHVAGPRAFSTAVHGAAAAAAAAAAAPAADRAPADAVAASAGFGYETMFLLQPREGETLDVDAVRLSFEGMGESLLVAGDESAVKIHVHNERPDLVIQRGLAHGSLSRITVEGLDAQAHEARERRAGAFTGSRVEVRDEGVPLAVIVIATGEGFARLFHAIGCAGVVWGGHGENPSTAELLQAIDMVNARHVLLLSTNVNVVLAARQAAELTQRPLVVVSARNAAEGLAALLAVNLAASLHENVEAMTRAARSIQTLLVTHAVRDAIVGGRRVTNGEVLVLDPDDGLVAAGIDETGAVLAAIDRLDPGYELLTVYLGQDADPAEADALRRAMERHRPDVEVEFVRGDQRPGRYLIAAE